MDSNLQIISGEYRGRKLALPNGARPTQNRARIAVFNMLNSLLHDAQKPFVIWDAFAGSGAFGLEFISRKWADSVIFTDTSDTALRAIKQNARGMSGKISILNTDALSQIEKFGKNTDLVFIDPPYDKAYLGKKFVHEFAKYAHVGAIVVWETDTTGDVVDPSEPADEWELLQDRKYGRARFLIMRKI